MEVRKSRDVIIIFMCGAKTVRNINYLSLESGLEVPQGMTYSVCHPLFSAASARIA